MTFSEFYFLLFPLSLTFFYWIRRYSFEQSKFLLLFFSIVFLFYADVISLLLLFCTALLNYNLIRLIRSGVYPRFLKLLGVMISLSPLLVYKGFLFEVPENTSDNVQLIFSAGIPLGLSFYALQQVTAILEGSKDKAVELSLKDYLTFSFFFVYLPSGPISPYKKLAHQFQAMGEANVPVTHINMGVSLFILGFAKKVLLADPINGTLTTFFALASSSFDITFSVLELSYMAWGSALQFYFEFSAYSDMAIGMGLCFGILLPVNFNSPFKAKEPVEYINSWHMSFMAFVREYVFQPVFSLVKKAPIRRMETRYIFAWAVAVFMTFLAAGIWHAPTHSAMLYSLYAAFLLVIFELILLKFNRTRNIKLFFLNQVVSRSLLLVSIVLLFTFIRVPSGIDTYSFFVSNLRQLYISLPPILNFLGEGNSGGYLQFDGFFPSYIYLRELGWNFVNVLSPGYAAIHIFIATIIVFFIPNTMEIFGLVNSNKFSLFHVRWRENIAVSILLGLLFVASLGMFTNNVGFIYGI